MARVDIFDGDRKVSFQNSGNEMVTIGTEKIKKEVGSETHISRVNLHRDGIVVYAVSPDPISVRTIRGGVCLDTSYQVPDTRPAMNGRILEVRPGSRISIDGTIVVCR